MQKLTAVAFVLFVITAAGYAQVPTGGNVFVGYSYNRASTGVSNTGNLNGWEGSVEGKFFPFVGMVVDFSQHYGTLQIPFAAVSNSVDTREDNYLFGPRVSFSVGKIRPFAHVLIGASHLHLSVSGATSGDTSFADAIGGGIDYHLLPLVAWRIQGDALQTRFNGNRQNDTRISTGLVVKF